MTDMFPGTKPRKRKRQPTAEVMRQQLALAADEIIRQREALERERNCPYWRRLLRLGPAPDFIVWSEPVFIGDQP